MYRIAGYFVAGASAAAVLLLITLAIPVLAAHAREEIAAPSRSAAPFVNRSLKGDQLPMAAAPDAELIQPTRLLAPRPPQCPAESNVPANPFATEIPGRCVV
jgi:hypothetical protein